VSISIDLARKILEVSKQRARELRSPVSIAIVDAGGHLVLFERMMSPYGWATTNISIAKACTAVMFNQPTDAVAQWGAGIPGFASSLAEMTHGKFIMAAGGWPIRLNGATIGGIGVSGGNAPGRDDDIARAGLAAIEAALPPQVPAQQYVPPTQSLPPMPAHIGMMPTPIPPSNSAAVREAAAPAIPASLPNSQQPPQVYRSQSQQPSQQGDGHNLRDEHYAPTPSHSSDSFEQFDPEQSAPGGQGDRT